jgi:ABC-type Co2+ transport system permease subunit
MSEELNQSPDAQQGPEVERQGPPEAAAGRAQGQQPASEIYIQPEERAYAGQPHYPPLPEMYAQAPGGPHIQNPYSAPAPGAPGFAPQPAYRYEALVRAQPLPLAQSLRELPAQYRKILLRPGVPSFAEEQGKAEWGVIWLQIFLLMVFETMLALPVGLGYIPALNNSLSSVGAAPLSSSVFLIALTVGVIVFAPIAFFIQVGIQYLLGRAFQGRGQFTQQAYNQLLFQVPTTFLISLLYVIMTPFLSDMASVLSVTSGSVAPLPVNGVGLAVVLLMGLLAWAISIYAIVLNVFAIMASHRISGGRATGVVLIPYAVLLVLYAGCICAGVFAALGGM